MLLLLRCSHVDEGVLRTAERLRGDSGAEVALAVDETQRLWNTQGFPKVSVSPQAFRQLGLFAPSDAAWRCGDYIYYLALTQFRNAEQIWLIEDDVRIREGRSFFHKVEEQGHAIDFLSGHLQLADPSWYWWAHTSSRDAQGWRCFFPVTRISRAAAQVLFACRLRHSADPFRRLLWPNDEAFVATTVKAAHLSASDLNGVVPGSWTEDSFGYETLSLQDVFVADGPGPHLHHPVLAEAAYARKIARLKLADPARRLDVRIRQRVARQVLSRRSWIG